MGFKRRIALREGARDFPKTRFFLFFPGLKGRRENGQRLRANKHHHATDKNGRRDRLRVKNYSFDVTYVSSGPGGFVSPVSSTFLRHRFSFLFVCYVRSFRAKTSLPFSFLEFRVSF